MLSLPSCLVKIILNSLPSFRGRKYSKSIPGWLSCKFCCLPNQLACSPFFTKWSYWLSLKLTAILKIEYKYQAHGHFLFIHLLPSTTYFPEAKLSSTFLSPTSWKFSKTFHQQPENIQRLFRLQNCFNRKSSAPENIQRLFPLQNCLSRKSLTISRKYSKTFWAAINSSNQQEQSAAAISSSNQQQQPAAAISSSNQQQQPAAAINSSNQQQQSAAAISSSNQQQQPAAAISSSNQQQQPAAAINSSN